MIRLDRISCEWPEFVIRDLSLEVEAGEYMVVMGPTGAGKTLLLELLLGIHRLDAGRIWIDGTDVTDLPPERRGIGMVYQDYAVFPHLDVRRNIAFGLRYSGLSRIERQRRLQETASLLGIEHLLHRYPGNLSGGEQQRVALGRALVIQPRVLLLDEPLSALDRATAERLRGELRALHEAQGLTVLHVTHDLAEAREMGSRIALVHEGAVHGLSTVEDLLRRPATLFAARFVGAVNLFPAHIEAADDGEQRAVAGPIVTACPADLSSSDLHILVHPDEVFLLDENAEAAAHVVRGEIMELRDDGHHVAVLLAVDGLDGPLTAFVSRQSARGLALRLGQPVAADLGHAIHLLSGPP